jgi:hypothetical protein
MGAMLAGDCFAALAMTAGGQVIARRRHFFFVIASGAKQSSMGSAMPALDCFVALSRSSQ